ncbi:MAG: hypothetical protein Q4D90_10770 [bacterium]|nr:hypothetical protein [bacterium]
MQRQEGRKSVKNRKKTTLSIDVANITLGLGIVILAVISFLNPSDHMLLLPVIFFLGAVLNLLNGIYGFYQSGREMKKKLGALFQCIGGILLLGVSILGVFSIWLV